MATKIRRTPGGYMRIFTVLYSYFRDIRFRWNEVKKLCHDGRAIQQPLVHIDIQDLGATLHLLFSNCQGLLEFSRLYQIWKPFAPSNVAPLSNIDEIYEFPNIGGL